MIMFRILLLPLLLACGPSWSEVKRHPGGIYEDSQGRCWNETYEPVACPGNGSGLAP